MERLVGLMRSSRSFVVSFLLILWAFRPATGRERLFRVLDTADGLPGVPVHSVAQDSEGFIWIATARGLARYDGVEVRPWGQDDYAASLDFVVAGPGGEVLAARHRDILRRVSGDSLVPLSGPEGQPIDEVWDADYDAEERLWVVSGRRLVRRDDGARWTVLPEVLLDGEAPFALAPGCGQRMLVSTWEGRIWDVAADGEAHVLGGPFPERVRAMRCDGDGHVLAGVHWHGLWRIGNGHVEKLTDLRNRGLSLVARGDAVWYVTVDDVTVIEGGHRISHLTSAERTEGFGEAIVDREGSLWIASYRGLVHYSEPETIVWQESDGLPVNHARFVVRSGDRVWISTWSGMSHFEESNGTLRLVRDASDLLSRTELCVDGAGRTWTVLDPVRSHRGRRPALVSLQGDDVRVHEVEGADPYGGFACARGPDATVWIAYGGVVLRAHHSGALVRIGASPSGLPHSIVSGLAVSGDEALWCLVGAATVCRSDAAEPTWSCEEVEGIGFAEELFVTSNGEIWMATDRRGVLRRGATGWETVPGLDHHARGQVIGLSPSPSGGVWVSGPGFVERVIESGGLWAVAEELTTWHGIPPTSVRSVLEDADGTVWMASLAGVVRVPTGVRETVPEAPGVTVTDVSVGGLRRAMDDPLVLPWNRNTLEVRFSTLSFRAPHLLRYRMRTRPGEDWTEMSDPSVRLVDLEPGRYTVELIASLDGRTWSPRPARLAVRVLPPWYRQTWALILAAAMIGGAVYGVHRMRMARVADLERQRTRIAADLHDDMGAGLGGIGILAGLAAEPDTPDEKRRVLASQVAEMAENLGAGLTDIVWSLRPDRTDLESLAHYVVERASSLFATGVPELVTRFPDPWPVEPLSLSARRNLQLIALEALRNAARHAEARRVEFGFGRIGSVWTLWVEDDGRGMPAHPDELERGLGMTSMRARARDMAAELRITPRPEGGTRLEVRFRPRAEDRARRERPR